VSVSKPRITIVGLGQIGASIGLALRQAEVASEVVGNDRVRGVAAEAKRLGAVDRQRWNLVAATEDADLVILATPVGEIKETLEVIGQDLRPGCVVVDTASLKGPVMSWAAERLPDGVHFVGGNPILGAVPQAGGGLDSASADLFRGGLFCLMPSPATDAQAVKLTTDLVAVLGAKPLFLDAAEHDGLLAGVEHLPNILSLALMQMLGEQPAWRELRKVAGPALETATQLVTPQMAADSDLYLLNKDNVLRWLDEFSASLGSIRAILAAGQSDVLAQRLEGAVLKRAQWLADRAQGDWQEGPRPQMPQRAGLFDTLLGGFWRRKPKDKA
jgi:prephenate dehydrogenase